MNHNGGSIAEVPTRDASVAILVVDDRESFRHVLRDLIAATPGFVLVGEAGSGEEAALAVESLSPALVLMDVLMPGMGGIAAAGLIASRHPEITVVLISVDDPSINPQVLALGDAVSCARKQDLRPQTLRELWESHRH